MRISGARSTTGSPNGILFQTQGEVPNTYTMRLKPAQEQAYREQSVDQAMNTIRNRIDQLGVGEVVIQNMAGRAKMKSWFNSRDWKIRHASKASCNRRRCWIEAGECRSVPKPGSRCPEPRWSDSRKPRTPSLHRKGCQYGPGGDFILCRRSRCCGFRA